MSKKLQTLPRRTIKSFVLRQGRLTKSQQKALDDLWPVFGVDVDEKQQDWMDIFGRKAELVLEIGFGMGQSLIQQATAEPEKNFIGIEVHKPGVGACLKEIDRLQLSNLRVINDDAMIVFEQMVSDCSLSRVQLYFPDPWHKKKHHKRRIVNPEFVQLIRRKLKEEGCFHMATDWQPYAEQMHQVMQSAEGYENLSSSGDYIPTPDFRPETKFETRGKKLGHGVWDLIYRKLF